MLQDILEARKHDKYRKVKSTKHNFTHGDVQNIFSPFKVPKEFRTNLRTHTINDSRRCDCRSIIVHNLYLGKVHFLLGGRAGASEGRVISESEHQKGRAIPHVSYSREGHTSFPEFFNENFCDVAFHFSYRLSFSFHLL